MAGRGGSSVELTLRRCATASLRDDLIDASLLSHCPVDCAEAADCAGSVPELQHAAAEGRLRCPLTWLALAGACLDLARGAGKGGFGVRAGSISGRLAVRRGLLACGFTGLGLLLATRRESQPAIPPPFALRDRNGP
jgi:hypothetical protein